MTAPCMFLSHAETKMNDSTNESSDVQPNLATPQSTEWNGTLTAIESVESEVRFV